VLIAGVAFGVLHNNGGRNWAFAAWASLVGVVYGAAFLYTEVRMRVPAAYNGKTQRMARTSCLLQHCSGPHQSSCQAKHPTAANWGACEVIYAPMRYASDRSYCSPNGYVVGCDALAVMVLLAAPKASCALQDVAVPMAAHSLANLASAALWRQQQAESSA
jgi:hypothetical protein